MALNFQELTSPKKQPLNRLFLGLGDGMMAIGREGAMAGSYFQSGGTTPAR